MVGLTSGRKVSQGILLYNSHSARGLKHDLRLALKKVLGLRHLTFDFSTEVVNFIQYLSDHGQNRYLDIPYYFLGDELQKLDQTVWEIRRYCQDMRGTWDMVDGKKVRVLPVVLRTIQLPEIKKNPRTFCLLGGFLEKVLSDPPQNLRRQALVWENAYYGQSEEEHISTSAIRTTYRNPPLVRDPSEYEILKNYVDFPPEIRKQFVAGKPRRTHKTVANERRSQSKKFLP